MSSEDTFLHSSQQLAVMPISEGIKHIQRMLSTVSSEDSSELTRSFFFDLPNILFLILGGENLKGWLTTAYESSQAGKMSQSIRTVGSSLAAEDNLDELVRLLSPSTKVGEKTTIFDVLFARSELSTLSFQLLASVLPDHLRVLRKHGVWQHPSIARFSNLFDEPLSQSSSSQSYVILQPSDWFLFAFVFNLKVHGNLSPAVAGISSSLSDDPYSLEFSQNPYLLLLRRYLSFFEHRAMTMNDSFFKKLTYIIEESFFVERIFSSNPSSLEPLIHHSILEGITNEEKYSSTSIQTIRRNEALSVIFYDETCGYSRGNVGKLSRGFLNSVEFSAAKNTVRRNNIQGNSIAFKVAIILLHYKKKLFRRISSIKSGGTLAQQQQLPQQHQGDFLRDFGDDLMLSLFFRRLFLFLYLSLDESEDMKDTTTGVASITVATTFSRNSAKQSLYDQGRLLLSLIAHASFDEEQSSIDERLFQWLDESEKKRAVKKEHKRLQQSQLVSSSSQINQISASSYLQNDSDTSRLPCLDITALREQVKLSILHAASHSSSLEDQGVSAANLMYEQLLKHRLITACTLLISKYVKRFSVMQQASLREVAILGLFIDLFFDGVEAVQEKNLQGVIEALELREIVKSCEIILPTGTIAGYSKNKQEDNEITFRLLSNSDAIEAIYRALQLKKRKGDFDRDSQAAYLSSNTQKTGWMINASSSSNSSKVSSDSEGVKSVGKVLERLHAIAKQKASQNRARKQVEQHQYKHVSFEGDSTPFEIANRKVEVYDYTSWEAPLASFESVILYSIALYAAFAIDIIMDKLLAGTKKQLQPDRKSELSSSSKVSLRKRDDRKIYPRTNLRRFANIYFTSILLAIFILFLSLRRIQIGDGSQEQQEQSNSSNRSPLPVPTATHQWEDFE